MTSRLDALFSDFPTPIPLHVKKAAALQAKKTRADEVAARKAARALKKEAAATAAAAKKQWWVDRKAAKAAAKEARATARTQKREARKAEVVAAMAARAEKPKAPRVGAHPLIHVYRGMVARCTTPTNSAYKYYGGRGVAVCDRWLDSFWNFVGDMGERPLGTSLDRIDTEGDYTPENCRWATKAVQYSNTSATPCYLATIRGVTKLVADWAREFRISDQVVKKHIRAGGPPDVAVISAVYRKELWGDLGKLGPEDIAKCLASAEKFCAVASKSHIC